MNFLELYARMFITLSIVLWGMFTITRLFSPDWMPRTGEQLVLSTTFRDNIQAENTHLPTIPLDARRVGLYRHQRKTTRPEDGEPSPPLGRLTKKKSSSDGAPTSLPRKHQSLKKVPPPSLRDEQQNAIGHEDGEPSQPSSRLTKNKSIGDETLASVTRSQQSLKKEHPPSLRDELYKVDDDGHFVIIHRHNKLHVPFKDAIKKFENMGDADTVNMNAFVDDDGHFVFGHQELPSPTNKPPVLTHRRLELVDVDNKDYDDGGEQMEEFQIQSSVSDDDGNFVILRRKSPMPYQYHPADSHLRPMVQVTNPQSKFPEEYDPQWQKNGRQPRRIITSEPEQETKHDDSETDNNTTAMLGPTILVVIAAIVIVCAAILYLCDLRDRCRYNQHWKKERPKQQQRRRRNVGTSFPLDMIVTPSQKHHKKNPLSMSNDHNPSHHSMDAGEIDHQQAVVVDWIRSMTPSSPISMEDHFAAQSPMKTCPVDLDEDHDVYMASRHIPAPDEDPAETPSFDEPTLHASPIVTAAMADRYAATDDEDEESQPTLVSVHDKVAAGVVPEEKLTISTPIPALPKAMLSPAVANALSLTRSEISILTEVSSDEQETADDEEEHRIEATRPTQLLHRGQLVSEEELDVTTTPAHIKKMFTVPSSLERSPDTLWEEERDATHQHPKAPNDDGDDELRISELTDQTDEHRQIEQLLTSFSYHSQGDGPRSTLSGEKNRTISSSSDNEDFIRDIFYVPTSSTTGTNDLSLKVIGASCPVTHPMITFVGEKSPLVGRVFVGDFVLRINEQEAGGISSDEVLEFLVSGSPIASRNADGHVAMGSKAVSVKMIKLTVMSSHADGSDTDASIDLGRSNSASEV